MKRRRFFQAALGASAASALLAQQQQVTPQPGPANPAPGIPLNPSQPVQPPGSASLELAKLDASVPDTAADMMPHYFTPAQLATLRHVSDLLMPANKGRAGASDAHAAEFLDFLISKSPTDRKEVYRAGLDGLNTQSTKRFGKAFAELDGFQTAELLAPLNQPWTYEMSSEPVARFLRTAKQDVRTATVNSREYAATAGASAGARRGGGGLYWYPLD